MSIRKIDLFCSVFLVIFSSCSNRLDILEPVDPIPVVYFTLNPADTIFYLTLSRTFSGDSSAYNLARDTNKVFCADPDITLEAWSGEYKIWETSFELSGRQKAPGIFPEVPGYCFKSANKLLFTEIYTSFRLVVDLPGMSTPAFSRIPARPIPLVPYRYDHEIALYPNGYEFPFSGGGPYRQLLCELHYQEYDGKWVDRTARFTLKKDWVVPGGDVIYSDLFFNRVAANIKPVNDTIVRKYISLDLICLSGDQNFKDYMDTYENAGDMDATPKGNINNGYGLFAMVTKATYADMYLDGQSLDSLRYGYRTRGLRFVKW